MPGAQQMAYVAELFTKLAWWRLRPAPFLLVGQPDVNDIKRTMLAAQSEIGDLMVAYISQGGLVTVRTAGLSAGLNATWFNPRTGERTSIGAVDNSQVGRFQTPDNEDWLLVLTK